jgi:hypothetical protein
MLRALTATGSRWVHPARQTDAGQQPLDPDRPVLRTTAHGVLSQPRHAAS